MSDILIKVEGLHKKFCMSLKRSMFYGSVDAARSMIGLPIENVELRKKEFWALQDINFELKRGETLGLIGRNGSGKTTLLRLINGIFPPDKGKITIKGRIGALIAVGAGFHPQMNGLENIYLNGTILGMTRSEIKENLDSIVDFADIGDFLNAPVATYSSGMTVRLGFAIAIHCDPDILLIDEILAVGDKAFRYKCYKKIDELRGRAAIIFVSHDLPSVVRICDNTIIMSKGTSIYHGNTSYGVEYYNTLIEESKIDEDSRLELIGPIKQFKIDGLPEKVNYNEPISFSISTDSDETFDNVLLHIHMLNYGTNYVASTIVDSHAFTACLKQGSNSWKIQLSSLPLKNGKYYFHFGLTDSRGNLLAVSSNEHKIILNGGHPGIVADCQLNVIEWINSLKS